MRKYYLIILSCTLLVAVLPAGLCQPKAGADSTARPAPGAYNHNDNGLWASRLWLHGKASPDAVAELARQLQARGITRFYPFLGPPNKAGRPGWRKDGVIQVYDVERVRGFIQRLKKHAPQVQIIPWTGGVLHRDIQLEDRQALEKYLNHLQTILQAGADGIQINVEPLPDGTAAYLVWLRAVKAVVGADKILSIAAYPPTTPLHPFPDVHWSLPFTRDICLIADDLAVMAYDTALKDPAQYIELMATWTRDLMQTLPAPSAGGCEWTMGVPVYEDQGVAYHQPAVENIRHALRGILKGLQQAPPATHFRGISLYASWTADREEWALYDELWRGVDAVPGVLPDFRGKR